MNARVFAIALVLAFPTYAQQQPPQTPFPSPLGGLTGAGGGGGGIPVGTACLLAGGADCAMANLGITFPSLGTGGAAITGSTCDSAGTVYDCLKLQGDNTSLAVGLADGHYLLLRDGYYIWSTGDNTGSWPGWQIQRDTADGRSRLYAAVYTDSKGSLLVGPEVVAAGLDMPVLALIGDANATGGDGVVHAGTQDNRASASANALFCASTNLNTADPDVVTPKSCVFADGTWQSGDGTAAKPSYSFMSAGSTDNGMYLAAADSLGWSTAGTNGMILDSNQNVGIGQTPDADSRLNIAFPGVVGNSTSVRLSRAAGAAGAENEWLMGITVATNVAAGSFFIEPADSGTVDPGSTADFMVTTSSLAAGAFPDFIIKSSGRVAIGSNIAALPTRQLHVSGGSAPGILAEADAGAIIRVTDTTGTDTTLTMSVGDSQGWIGTDSNDPFGLLVNNVERATVKTTEFVINDSSADYDFRVESNANANAIFLDSGAETLTFFSKFTIVGASGHLTSAATASVDAGTGTCTTVTVVGNDVRGIINATCTAGQTVIMNFGTAYGSAPICVISPTDLDSSTAVGYAVASTSALTVTALVGDADSSAWAYHCIE